MHLQKSDWSRQKRKNETLALSVPVIGADIASEMRACEQNSVSLHPAHPAMAGLPSRGDLLWHMPVYNRVLQMSLRKQDGSTVSSTERLRGIEDWHIFTYRKLPKSEHIPRISVG